MVLILNFGMVLGDSSFWILGIRLNSGLGDLDFGLGLVGFGFVLGWLWLRFLYGVLGYAYVWVLDFGFGFGVESGYRVLVEF